MTRKTIGLISIILAVVVGIGALMTIPAVYAETKTVVTRQSVTAGCAVSLAHNADSPRAFFLNARGVLPRVAARIRRACTA
ncbi:hypothetical protein SMC1_03585 [Candidatus Cryosericum septentrionale]|jgi:flagellar basal body-associated protein FliL|uniref:Uncharacterized protein n=1 Tax=Candidatus Cryosericum septentrionale TaxID=2290913 RepID=A0A398DYS3_9BACT|nr:hypothetical protein SMC1_03585 [Candidatus Cryosericum septentrionale]